MAKRLKEWASGKAGVIASRVYSILTKYTGIKFKICPTFHAYKNKWGVFFGKVALASNGRFYRLNFSRGKTDEIVSMDVWGKGQDALTKLPLYSCSFEGFGISQIVLYLKDFILDPEHNLTEHISLDNDTALLRESADELRLFIAAFLAQSPVWQNNWASGKVDDKQYFKAVSTWIRSNQVNGAKYSGKVILTTPCLVRNTKTLIEKNPSVLGATASASASVTSSVWAKM